MSQPLSIYLVRKDFKHADSILKDIQGLSKHSIRIGDDEIGELYVRPTESRPPPWASFFRDVVDTAELGENQSTAAVLVVEASGRTFALTFGIGGRFLLVPECWEERFGLMTSLNTIDHQRIRSIDKDTFDALPRHTREQSSREAETHDFGFDIEQDLLRAVTGTPNDKDRFGKRLSGLDSLHAVTDTGIAGLRSLLEAYYDRFKAKDYQKHFGWIDRIRAIRSKRLVEKLDELLVKKIANKDFDRSWLAAPDIIDWSRAYQFSYSSAPSALRMYDIHWWTFVDELRHSKVDLAALKRRRAYCFDANNHVIADWQIYKCANCEIDYDGNTYLLSVGKWFQIEKSFVARVNKAIEELPGYEHDLPEFNDDTETLYLKRVADASSGEFALMDKKTIWHGGRYGQVEFCDLFGRGNDIIHVKRYGGSSVLSHLFSQGRVSGELFRHDFDFRRKVNDKLPESHQLNPALAPTPEEYRVIFAVVSGSEDELTLPFFSRVNLRRAARSLKRNGYRVALSKIPVNEILRKTRRPRSVRRV